MASSNHSENAAGSQIRMSDHPEWKRMLREIVTLRQVTAKLAEKVTTLEMQLEDIYREESREVVSPIVHSTELSLELCNDRITWSKQDTGGLLDAGSGITVDWRKEENTKASTQNQSGDDVSVSSHSHKRKLDMLDGGDHAEEAMMSSEVKRSKPPYTQDLPDQARGLNTISAITNPVPIVSDQSSPFSQPDFPSDHSPATSDTHMPMAPETTHGSNIPSSPKQPRRIPTGNQLQNFPLPQYHPDLPQIDRMKRSKAFYIDLQDKFIIAGFDEERFSCWCHVEKGNRGGETALSVNHTVVQLGKVQRRHRSRAWFHHAERCRFYKDPWATTSQGQRLFPSFPLPKPGGTSASNSRQEVICAGRKDWSMVDSGRVSDPSQ